MIRLILLTAAAFLVIMAVLAVTGDAPEPTRATVAPPAPASASPTTPASAAPAETPEPAPELLRDEVDPEGQAGIVPGTAPDAPTTTEADQPDMPGPPLRPSPQYADTPAPEALAEASAAEPGATLYVTGNSVNFRAGPSTSDSVIGALRRGAEVTPLGPLDGDWVEIRDAQGRRGFISAQFLSPDAP